MISTTEFRATVGRHAARVKEIVRIARGWCTREQDQDYARSVAKANLSSERGRAIEQCVALIVDAARRGPVEYAAMIGEHLTAVAYAEHPDQSAQLAVSEAHILEELAEGEVEVWETKMARDPSVTNCLGYLGSAAKHSAARRQLNVAVRREMAQAGAQ